MIYEVVPVCKMYLLHSILWLPMITLVLMFTVLVESQHTVLPRVMFIMGVQLYSDTKMCPQWWI